jgi:GH18 family chitinase
VKSVTDPTRSATATVTVTGTPSVAVSVAPNTVTVVAGATQSFTATVTGTTNTAVSWSLQESSGCGTVSSAGSYVAPTAAATCHVVATSIADATKKAVATVTVTSSGGSSPVARRWVTGYYAAYYGDTYYPHTLVDMTKLTHFVFARAQPNDDATITLAAGVYGNTMAAPLIARAHAAGTKAILMAGGAGDSVHWYPASSDATRAKFVTNILALLDQYGFDGVDIDWEEYLDNSGAYPDTQRRLLALLQDLRAARPGLIITFPGPWINSNIGLPFPASWALQMANAVDQFNVMSYDMTANWGWNTWFFGALDGAGGLTPTSIASTVAAYRAAGIPAAKIGIGIGFYGHDTEAPNTGPNQAYSGSDHGGQDFLLRSSNIIKHYLAEYSGHATKVWNPTAKMYSLTSTSNWAPAGSNDWSQAWFPLGFFTWEDEASIQAKARYVRDNGLGGTIIWTIDNGCTNTTTGENPYLTAVGDSFLAKVPPNPIISRGIPAYASSGTAANANSAPYYANPWTSSGESPAWLAYDLSGVPAHQRGQVIAFVHYDTNIASFDGGSGGPSSYTIRAHAGAGGSAPPADGDAGWVTLATVTGNTWTGRQHLVNLTSGTTIYNWIKLRVTAAQGGASVRSFFDVHDASQGSNDDVVFFGDSINVGWATHLPYSSTDAAAAGVPAASLSDMVLTARPGKMPVFQGAGIVGWYSSAEQPNFAAQLATAQGKYVSIGYGSNEALNAWSDASHHTLFITSMQSMIDTAHAAGKTVIIPTMPYGTNASIVTYGPVINGWINELYASNPTVIKGPDQWAWGQAHTQFIGGDGVHYLGTGGYLALRAFWAQWLVANLY